MTPMLRTAALGVPQADREPAPQEPGGGADCTYAGPFAPYPSVYQVDPHFVYVTPPAGTAVALAHGGAGAGGGGVAGAVVNSEDAAAGGGGALAAAPTAETVPTTAAPVAAMASPLPASHCWSS